MLVWIFGDCREGQRSVAFSGFLIFSGRFDFMAQECQKIPTKIKISSYHLILQGRLYNEDSQTIESQQCIDEKRERWYR